MSFVRRMTLPSTLSPAEQKAILEVTGQHVDGYRDHMIISFALGTGMREVELHALRCGDVVNGDQVRSRVTLTTFKGAQRAARAATAARAARARGPRRRAPAAEPAPSQEVMLPRALRRKLEKYFVWKKRRGEPVAPPEPLFLSQRGKAISTRMIRYMFRSWQIKARFERVHGFHRLRHTMISNLYRRTKNLRLVQIAARHANASTTELYTHVDDDLRTEIENLPC